MGWGSAVRVAYRFAVGGPLAGRLLSARPSGPRPAVLWRLAGPRWRLASVLGAAFPYMIGDSLLIRPQAKLLLLARCPDTHALTV